MFSIIHFSSGSGVPQTNIFLRMKQHFALRLYEMGVITLIFNALVDQC